MNRSQVGQVIRSQKQYFEAMIRNGYILPKFHSPLVHRDYLDGVRAGCYYAPHRDENFQVYMAINAPPKQVLINMFKVAVDDAQFAKSETVEVLLRMSNLLELMEEGKLPDN